MLKMLSKLWRGESRTPLRAVPAPVPQVDVDALLAIPAAAVSEGRISDALSHLRELLEVYPDLAEAHLLLGRLLHDQKDFEEARDSYLLASAYRADWWHPHFELGRLAMDQKRMAEAALTLAKAIELGAQDAEVHNMLGAARLLMGDSRAAAACFRTALALDPELVAAHSNLGYTLFKNLEEYDEGERHIARALELAPDDSAALCNSVMVSQQRGRHDETLALANRLLASDPSRPEVRMNRALVYLTRGEFGHAWADYEARKQLPESRRSDDLPWPDWDGSSLEGKTIYVYREQGIGDEIMFASCLPEIIALAKGCVLECSAKLAPIFRRSFPGAQIVARNAWRDSPAFAQSPPDCKAAIGSLPFFLRRTFASFPAHGGYLHADERRVGRWRERLSVLPGRLKVGISWRGGLATTQRGLRSIPLRDWMPVLTVPGIDFVSVQYADPDKEVDALRDTPGIHVHHWQEAVDDYDETAALVEALDLVISVQTAVVHLGGALGRRVWALIPEIPEWRYGARGHAMVWYPSVRLIRQPGAKDWAPVIDTVRGDLENFLETAKG